LEYGMDVLLKNTKRRWRSQLRKTMNYEDYESTLYSWIFVGTVGL
jgi:transposase-like protein